MTEVWNFEKNTNMLFNTTYKDDLTFAFLIPHVSKLLVYKDHWNKSHVMRKVIQEVLHARLFTKLYLGSEPIDYCIEYNPCYRDCAIITISVSGMTNLSYTPKTVTDFFADEIGNSNNMFHFNNTRLSMENNVSCIEIAIRIAHTSAPAAENDIQAA
jgi:hypothetical protein